VNWDASYTVSPSIVLRIGTTGALLAGDGHEVAEDALPVLTSFANPSTPRAVFTNLQESWEIDEAGFATLVDALLSARLLTPGPAPSRDLYLVLGINRSGTSALTKALAACGVSLDFESAALPLGLFKPDANRADGGYESYEILPVLMLVREITARHGGDQNKPVLTDEIVLSASDALAIRGLLELIPRFPFAIKDPLLTFQYPQWKEVARACRPAIATRPVVTLRHPVAAAHALLRRGFCSTLRSGLDQWFRYYSEVQYLVDAGEEPLIVVYDGERDHFAAQIEALCAVLSLPFDGARVRAEFVPAGVDRPDRAELQQHPLGRTLEDLFTTLSDRRRPGG